MKTESSRDAWLVVSAAALGGKAWIVPLLLLLASWDPSLALAGLVQEEGEIEASSSVADPGLLQGEAAPGSLEAEPDELELAKSRIRELYRSLYRATSDMLQAPEGAVRDSLQQEVEKLHQEIASLRAELEQTEGERALRKQTWHELDRDIRRAARQGDTEQFDAELERFLSLLTEVGGEIGQQIGHVQLEISADRFRLATDGGGYIDVRIPEEVRENLKNGVITFNQQLGQVLSDSMLQEIGHNLEKYTHESGLTLELLQRLKEKPKRKKWIVIGSSVFKTGRSFTVNDDELVKGDVVMVGESLIIEGKVLGKAVCLGGDIEIGPDGVIEGDAVSIGGDVVQQEGASVEGRVVDLGRLVPPLLGSERAVSYLTILMLFLRLLVLVVLAMILFALMGDRMRRMCEHCVTGVARPFLEGMFWLVLAITVFFVVAVTLALTIIGIPVALLSGIVFGALLFSAYLVTCQLIGGRILGLVGQRRPPGEWQSVLVGLLVLELPALLLMAIVLVSTGDSADLALPRSVDLAIKFFALSLGFGCIMRSRFGAGHSRLSDETATVTAETPS